MNTIFITESIKSKGIVNIFDVTDDKKIFAGSVKPFTWNKNVCPFDRLEPFDKDGEMLHQYNCTLEELIEIVKSSYITKLKDAILLDDKWKEKREFALSIGVSEEMFKEYYNVRIYINNIILLKEQLEIIKQEMLEVKVFVDSHRFNDVPLAVKKLIVDRMDLLTEQEEDGSADMIKYENWIKNYKI